MSDLATPTTVDAPRSSASRRGLRAKRVVDVLGATTALVLASPVMLLAAVAIRLTMGRPILFVQQRPGLDGALFPMRKFRTMTDAPEGTSTDLDATRTTRLGRMLRSTSIDELPELLNVLRGEMSLVGPRPLLAAYRDLYTPEQARRHEVRPGITGLAQTTGRKGLSWDETFALDVWYVDHRSFALDLRILARTVAKVVTDITSTDAQDHGRPDFGVPTAATSVAPVGLDDRSTPRPPSGPLRVLSDGDLVAWKRGRGAHIVTVDGHHWERHHGGFYQPAHLLDRLRADEVRRPSGIAWGWRAALDDRDASEANASIPVRLLADVAAYDATALSGSRRNQLRRCRKRAHIEVLSDPAVLHRYGHELVRSCADRIGFAAPDARAYHDDLDRYLTDAPLVLTATDVDDRLVGYLTAYATGDTAYVDRVYVHTDALNTYASVGLLYDLVVACQATPGIRQVVHGQDRRENPSLGRFKEGMGFALVQVPSRVHLWAPVDAVVARRRPDAYHRLTGRG